jgi:hypothetical protein
MTVLMRARREVRRTLQAWDRGSQDDHRPTNRPLPRTVDRWDDRSTANADVRVEDGASRDGDMSLTPS